MTIREWCQRTYNVLLGGCDAIIYQPNDPGSLFVHEIEVRLDD